MAASEKTEPKMGSARRAAMKGGRFTPKGTPQAKPGKGKTDGTANAKPTEKTPAYAQSGRFTAPTAREEQAEAMQETKPWVVPVLAAFLVLGLLLIINYYVGVLPGGRSGWYLLGGLAAITAGFGVATQLK